MLFQVGLIALNKSHQAFEALNYWVENQTGKLYKYRIINMKTDLSLLNISLFIMQLQYSVSQFLL